ncbi:homeobox protein HAT3.1 isoform X2 [Mangifera indica]|uniref:homeobox protein HAT3.1 isoform X2 n=1 Tax=Mangifera indica TaxID=29780 RepID=UPI001CF9CA9F|nr:homeobox protein HAT3.1 isoform X2 [Mangifera indica]
MEVSYQNGNDSCSTQITSEQTNKFGAECAHSEPPELQGLPYSEGLQNKSQEINTPVTNFHTNEGFSRDVSNCSETNNFSCSQQILSVPKNEFAAECMPIEKLEVEPHLDSEIILEKFKETNTVMCSPVDNENLQAVTESVSKGSQTDAKQTLKFGLGRGCDDFTAESICSGLLEQKHQLGFGIMRHELEDTDAMITNGAVNETLQRLAGDVTKIYHTEGVNMSSQTGENSCSQQPTSEKALELTAGITSCDQSEVIYKDSSELLNQSSTIEHLKQPDVPIKIPDVEHLEPSCDDLVKNSCHSQTPPKDVVKNSSCLDCKGKKASKSLKKKYMLGSLRCSDRVLRSRSQEKPKAPEPSNNLADVSSSGGKKINQKRRKKKIVADEYSRIRRHLGYLLNRINYEQSLISAYSGEGWKGLNVEKLKPEKELKRATSEILRLKLKIRDLFQHLDSLCAEGQFPESLFDSDGQIDSEDIFCAKCGSKDLSTDNDIILCDGACDRGFHQFCLEPPLLKEDIPPDDEGWLCPGCDCKVDCIDSVNESQGTNLFITDNWEKVFPEAAAAGHDQDPNFGLPSDDSVDADYDPDDLQTNEKDQGDESSSDKSDYFSASDEVEPLANNNCLGLPSDDSEDDEYDPDALVLDEKITQESSSSDFTSDSEDLAAIIEDNGSSGNDEGATSVSPLGDSNGQMSKCGGNKECLNNELLSILEVRQDGLAHAYEKRSVERLDYKKLYDETYENVTSDSSDYEDWTDDIGPRKRTKRTAEGSPVSPNGNAPIPRSGKQNRDIKGNQKETEQCPNRETRQKLSSETTKTPPAKSHERSSTPGSSGRAETSSSRRLGESVTQSLYKSFKENQYPDRTAKETLAKELGLTFSQVSKWFENARWNFRHSSSMDARLGISTSEKSTSLPLSNKKQSRRVSTGRGAENVESSKAVVHDMDHIRGDLMNSRLGTKKTYQKKSTAPKPRNRMRKGKLGHQASDLPADSPEAQESQTSSLTQTRRRKTDV